MWRAMVVRGLRSCHEILGLTPQASKEELKLRYHELARSLHPDVCPTGTTKSPESFAELAEAYATCLRLTRSSPTSAASPSSSPSTASAVLWPPRWAKPRHNYRSWRVFGLGQGLGPGPSYQGSGTSSTASKSYQGQPWKWRIKGPLTISAQRKAKGFLRR
ncbi:dnaJ [Symbiodinium sp. CCMP2592]|nr:dnaJ [Symbiodinium sp. CCMP2592]